MGSRVLVATAIGLSAGRSAEEFADKKETGLISAHFPAQPLLTVVVFQNNEMTSLQMAAFQAPYRAPAHIDLLRMEHMLLAKLHAAEDHLHAMREDPPYFANTLLNWVEHSSERYAKFNKAAGPSNNNVTLLETWN
ncbi:uncharacterized protein JN550_009106 [Neoarthrinium moseri]|uniref:uncharacterized protein n=1 Tax=Neoarthrinium moseri TaxID=1658444 RepID=UPI001FDC0058|nr:uncharacterized protein JN550_009106 [Neoarthrinium moseri]KAI1864086.1 hypothetical protein JN550_009106 [Neoarthrinium moseri]